MNIILHSSEVILEIFAALLSLAVSIFLIVLQKASDKSMSKISNEQNILKVSQNEIKDLVSRKITSTSEIQDAADFLVNDARVTVDGFEKDLTKLQKQKITIARVTLFGLVVVLFNLGSTLCLTFVLNHNNNKVDSWTLTAGIAITILMLISLGIEIQLIRVFERDFKALGNRVDNFLKELSVALEVIHKNAGYSSISGLVKEFLNTINDLSDDKIK